MTNADVHIKGFLQHHTCLHSPAVKTKTAPHVYFASPRDVESQEAKRLCE